MYTTHSISRHIAASLASILMLCGLTLYLSPSLLHLPPLPRILPWSLAMGAFFLIAAAAPTSRYWLKHPLRQTTLDPPTACSLGIEQIQLSWLWLLGAGVAAATALVGDEAVASPPLTALFLMAVCLYWSISLGRIGKFRSGSFRIPAHAIFTAVALSVLLIAPGPIGQLLLAPLTATFALSLAFIGAGPARITAAACSILLALGSIYQWLLAQQSLGLALAQSLAEIAALVGAVEVGLLVSSMQKRLVEDALATRQQLEQSNQDLQATQDQLQAKNEELQAQNEQLLRQHELLNCQRRQLEDALTAAQLNEQLFRGAFENAPIGVILLTVDGVFKQVNRAFCQLTGYSEAELVDRDFQGLLHPDDLTQAVANIRQLEEGSVDSYSLQERLVHKDGHHVWVSVSASIIRDRSGTPAYRIGQVMDITNEKRYEWELLHMARFDPLTDLLNRRAFQEEVDQHLTEIQNHQGEAALIYLDLDQFKFVNDNMGHEAGDTLLQGVARVLRQELHETDVVARLGGDEFAAFLPHTPPEKAKESAQRVL